MSIEQTEGKDVSRADSNSVTIDEKKDNSALESENFYLNLLMKIALIATHDSSLIFVWVNH